MYGLWVFLLLCCSPPSAFSQAFSDPVLDPASALTDYVHVAWGEEEGLPQGSINAIAQTADGYVWLGTQEGLVRFDGIKFTVFDRRIAGVFGSNDIRVLTRDRQGDLWIGTRNAGLYRYRDGEFTSANHLPGLKKAGITALLEGRQGELWIGTASSGLKLLHEGVMTSVELPALAVSSLYETEAGVLWIGTYDAGLIRYQDGVTRIYTRDDGLPENDVTALAPSDDGGLWIGTRKSGLVHLHKDSLYVATTAQGLPSNRILTLFEDPAGSLWIGTNQGGLARLTLDLPGTQGPVGVPRHPTQSEWEGALRISSMDASNGLTYDVVKSIFLDREGNMLIGTDGRGLNLLREGKFTMYTEKVGLPDNYVYSIHEDLSGAMWFSTEKGVGRLSEGAMSSFSSADGLADDYVISLASASDGSVWMGTYDGGLSRFYNGDFTTFTQKNGLPENRVYGLYSDSRGRLWVGTGSGVARMGDGQVTAFTTAEGLSSNLVTVVLESTDESVWIGTYNAGLNKVQGDALVPFAAAGALANVGVLALYEDKEGVLWIGTYGDGLIRVKDGDVVAFTTEHGLFNDTVLQILEDDLGYLWMSSNKGLSRVEKKQLHELAAGKIDEIHAVVYGKGDGLKSNEFNGGVQNAGWKSRDGRLWFPSSQGVASIDPQNIRKNEVPPLIEVEQVFVDDRAVPLKDPLTLNPGVDRMEIHYAGLSLVSPEKMRYQYQLIGEDETWVDAGTRRFAYYSNLGPGSYQFNVRVQNSDGVWSQQAASFPFYHNPFFFQKKWFFLICGFIGLIGLVGVFRLRMKQLHEQKVQLEQQVNERTADLLIALEENKEILSITSHDLKNPLSGFIGLSELLLEDFSDRKPDPSLSDSLESLQLMKNEAERMLRIVKELLDRHQVKDDDAPHAINLIPLLQDVILRHQKNANQKNIRLIFEHEAPLFVVFNENAMLRIADNLLSNAIKFSPPDKRVWLKLAILEDSVTFVVQDEGPGLTDEDQARVFGKLQRLSARPTAGEQSTGWGLFIVKQLAEEHGAKVGVHSKHGQGASFWVRIPLSVIETNVLST